ncbi:MAG: hypothetical protein ABI811_11870 [Acidobacteriota bacterium]
MRRRLLGFLLLGLLIHAAVFAQAPASAVRPAAAKPAVAKPPVPRTADGKPDLSGVWQGGSLSFAIGNDNASQYSAPTVPTAGTAPAKPEPMPYTAEAQKIMQGYRDRRGIDDPMARCLMVGVPRITSMPMPFQITQTKEQTLILYESFHAFRIIPSNGRPHPEDLEPSFMGDSTGHWEGDTFVVDVIGFNTKTWLGGVGTIHSEKLHVTERYTRTDFDTILYEVKMEDPEVFTKPYNQRATIRLRPNDRVREYECGENNEDIVRFETILKGQVK